MSSDATNTNQDSIQDSTTATDFGYQLICQDGDARRGVVTTAHGQINTPAFMPVGTAATVKAMFLDDVKASGAEIMLGNTYHLMLRPTAERVARLGGLRKFMNWSGPVLTDSGGFQVMSLSKMRTIDEQKGVRFKSHIDGSYHLLSPERSIEIQDLLDATITMAFDECPALPASYQDLEKSMQMSMKWAERSLKAYRHRAGYGIFGIVQGGTERTLRVESASILRDLDFHGYSIGGLAVGEPQEEMFATLEYTLPELPEHKPRYLMGVGTPHDIVGSVKRGIDMFDCVMPTRAGRHHLAFTHYGRVKLRNSRHKDDPRPLDDKCHCPTCQNYSRAYLYHLAKCEEPLAGMLLTMHNIYYYQSLMKDIRTAIEQGRFLEFEQQFLADMAAGDIPLYE